MNLEAFLTDVITPMLDHPDAFRVEVTSRGREREALIFAEGDDRGRIIGRNGRVISALRTLCITAGEKAGLDVRVELHDEDEEGPRRPRRSEGRPDPVAAASEG